MALGLLIPIASFALGLVSSTVVWFYFEPLSEVKNVISQTDADLQYYARVITSPGPENHGQAKLDEASEALRTDAAQLRAASNQVPKYRVARYVAGLPSRDSIDIAARKLMGLSNTVYADDHERNTEWKEEIEDKLELSE
ncbi:hypothetical protein [Halobacterium litoreum]|uniref:Uncharacterized protein n=1 Tax=Halobacterium litoreum TaxID=2039234 RepID=A0ABD5NCX1_9EURY|nr:hypothetical protein [Halobacterium litoreum]UHH14159.1 hypothetical protein LT972_03955 [Halobacterium litoreum]